MNAWGFLELMEQRSRLPLRVFLNTAEYVLSETSARIFDDSENQEVNA